jgi:GT2 family glycosyltransferase
MNEALRKATGDIVLFVDDDIVPAPGLVAAHADAYEDENVWAVTGQVLQPGEEPDSAPHTFTKSGLKDCLDFSFRSTGRAFVRSVMAGNLSVRREKALEIGGFDENFVGAAYRFETEFCRRIWHNGGKVLYEPAASIRHLRTKEGGTRRFGNHLKSADPAHGVGDYYFALRCGRGMERIAYIISRPFREVSTRFHLYHPWWIPVKLIGEMRAIALAMKLAKSGPALLTDPTILRSDQTGLEYQS